MPRRDVRLTVVLADTPYEYYPPGAAISADGNDEWGMIKGRLANSGDDIIGWTIRKQDQGDVATLRTSLDGTILAQVYNNSSLDWYTGVELYLMNDASGRLTQVQPGTPAGIRPVAQALEADNTQNESSWCEVYVLTQKAVVIP